MSKYLKAIVVYLVITGMLFVFYQAMTVALEAIIPNNSSEQAIGYAKAYYALNLSETNLVKYSEVTKYSKHRMRGLHMYETYYLVDYEVKNGALYLRSFYVGVQYAPNDTSYFRVETDMVLQSWSLLLPL